MIINKIYIFIFLLVTPYTIAGEPSLKELSDELHLLHSSADQSLRWRLPNKKELVSAEEVKIKPSSCEKPIPSQINKPVRFLVRCSYTKWFGNHFVKNFSTSSWSKINGKWSPGQIIYSYEEAPRLTTRKRTRIEYSYHEGEFSSQYESFIKKASASEAEKLRRFWDNWQGWPKDALEKIEFWREISWPEALVGIKKDSSFFLQYGSVAGISSTLDKIKENKIPSFADGVIKLESGPRHYGPGIKKLGPPVFLLHSMSADNYKHALIIDRKKENDSDANEPLTNVVGNSKNLVMKFVTLP
ncbi:hypothetical protein [Oceanimonas smirnovii]|uniref:hypothetical protein n=1 Tax=Oceanimonas smirnovii TaxID=264574 RepID=UPI0003A3BCAB|nr:hypothetical protein [Oceanimonas smirnovii]